MFICLLICRFPYLSHIKTKQQYNRHKLGKKNTGIRHKEKKRREIQRETKKKKIEKLDSSISCIHHAFRKPKKQYMYNNMIKEVTFQFFQYIVT